jgi:hypothetical protein
MVNREDEIASAKRAGTGDREYMRGFTRGRDSVQCESCGITMRRVPDFGTEQDGEPSDHYCTGCYQQGAFVEEASSAAEFLERAAGRIAAQRGESPNKVKLALRKELPKLPRWR